MTVPATSRRAGPFTGNGVTTSFPFAFKTFAAADLRVVRTNLSGIDTDLVLNSDYTVSLNGDQDASPGGNIVLPSALTAGFKLTVVGDLEFEQTTDLPTGGAFNARTVEDALDRQTIFSQQLQDQLSRALKVSVSSPPGLNVELPSPTANYAIGWNGSADGLININPANWATVVATAYTVVDKWTADGSTLTYALSNHLGSSNFAMVSIAGVVQNPGVDYSISGNLLTFVAAPPANTVIQARYIIASGQTPLPQAAFATENYLASAGQATFTLQTAYIPGANSLEVFVNGLRMSPAIDYAETSANVITFVSGLTAGDEVTFVIWTVTTAFSSQIPAITAGSSGKALRANDTGNALTFENITMSVLTSGATLTANRRYGVNSNSGAFNLTLPATMDIGDWIELVDVGGVLSINNVTVLRGAYSAIRGLAEDLILDINWDSLRLVNTATGIFEQ